MGATTSSNNKRRDKNIVKEDQPVQMRVSQNLINQVKDALGYPAALSANFAVDMALRELLALLKLQLPAEKTKGLLEEINAKLDALKGGA